MLLPTAPVSGAAFNNDEDAPKEEALEATCPKCTLLNPNASVYCQLCYSELEVNEWNRENKKKMDRHLRATAVQHALQSSNMGISGQLVGGTRGRRAKLTGQKDALKAPAANEGEDRVEPE